MPKPRSQRQVRYMFANKRKRWASKALKEYVRGKKGSVKRLPKTARRRRKK